MKFQGVAPHGVACRDGASRGSAGPGQARRGKFGELFLQLPFFFMVAMDLPQAFDNQPG
jgi:hypothetical protein